ncbi:MAG: hypothetical protein Q7R60_01810 [bacterium]|nr:hypothetical protein [bacterium]
MSFRNDLTTGPPDGGYPAVRTAMPGSELSRCFAKYPPAADSRESLLPSVGGSFLC